MRRAHGCHPAQSSVRSDLCVVPKFDELGHSRSSTRPCRLRAAAQRRVRHPPRHFRRGRRHAATMRSSPMLKSRTMRRNASTTSAMRLRIVRAEHATACGQSTRKRSACRTGPRRRMTVSDELGYVCTRPTSELRVVPPPGSTRTLVWSAAAREHAVHDHLTSSPSKPCNRTATSPHARKRTTRPQIGSAGSRPRRREVRPRPSGVATGTRPTLARRSRAARAQHRGRPPAGFATRRAGCFGDFAPRRAMLSGDREHLQKVAAARRGLGTPR